MRRMEIYHTEENSESDDVFPTDDMDITATNSDGVIQELLKIQGQGMSPGTHGDGLLGSPNLLENLHCNVTRARSFKTKNTSFFRLGRSLSLKREAGTGRVYRYECICYIKI